MLTYPQWHDDTQAEAQNIKGLIQLLHNTSEGRWYKVLKEIKNCNLQAATLVIAED